MRFGPYHLARLLGAAARFSRAGMPVSGIEVAGTDQYDWRREPGSGDFVRHCLFQDSHYESLGASAIRRAMIAKLNELQPAAVGINGWSVPEARAALSWCGRNRRIAILMSETHAGGRRRAWWKEMIKRLIVRKFDAAVVGGRIHAEYAVSLGISRHNVFTGYDAVDNNYFAAGTESIRRKASLEGRKAFFPELVQPYFYANTRLLRRKNVHGLLSAYSEYRRKSPDPWNLVITGSGEEEPGLKRKCADLGLGSYVAWPGFVQYDQLPLYYGLAGAFIHPAISEPWGLVVNEACASSLPVLSSRTVGATSELVEDGKNGFLFEPSDSPAMAVAMARVAGMTAEQRDAMGRRSGEIVAGWGPDRFGDALSSALAVARAGCCR